MITMKTNKESYSRLQEMSELELFFQLEQMKANETRSEYVVAKEKIVDEIKRRYPKVDMNAWVLNWKHYLEALNGNDLEQLAICRRQNLALDLFVPTTAWQFYSISDETEIPAEQRKKIEDFSIQMEKLSEVDLFFLTHYFSKAIGDKMIDYQKTSKQLQKVLRNFSDPLEAENQDDFQIKTENIKRKFQAFDQLVTKTNKVVDRNYSVMSQTQIQKIKDCYLAQIEQTEAINQLWGPLNRCLLETRRFGVPVQVRDRITGEYNILDENNTNESELTDKIALTTENSNTLLWYNNWRQYFQHANFITDREIDRTALEQLHLENEYHQENLGAKQKKLVS